MGKIPLAVGDLLERCSRRTGWCILAVALATLGIRVALLPVRGFPSPSVHDEFSYLLGADTFASGRLSNPMHKLWPSFESIHILVRPKYATNFQPGQSLFLAFGQKVFGHPYYGVMLSVALMNAALCWMLFGWTSRRWALLVSLYPILYFTAGSRWMETYFGGAIVAMGAALILGAYPRLVRRPSVGLAALFTFGLSLLFLTRPYEGGCLAIAVTLLLAWHLWRRRSMRTNLFRWRMLLPVLILVATATFQMALNRGITGSFFTLPYILHLRTYEVAPIWWAFKGAGPPRPGPAPEVFKLHSVEYRDYLAVHDALPWSVMMIAKRVLRLLFMLLYPVLLFPFLLPAARKDPWLRTLLAFVLACFLSLILEVWSAYHYEAPFFAVMVAFTGRGLWKTSRAVSPGGKLALMTAAFALIVLAPLARHAYVTHRDLTVVSEMSRFAISRAGIESSLTHSGQRHLVFVRYLPNHDIYREWVYNKADIDKAPVIWARDLGLAQNDQVIAYYGKSRHYWLLEADVENPQLKDYVSRQDSALASKP